MAKKKTISKEQKQFPETGLLAGGCLFIGLGFDFLFGTMPAGTIIGLGVGLILMFWLQNEKK